MCTHPHCTRKLNLCAYSDITIKQTVVVDYYTEVKLQAFKTYICIYKEQKRHPIEKKTSNALEGFFFANPTCLKNE